jgi:hypothetical protein
MGVQMGFFDDKGLSGLFRFGMQASQTASLKKIARGSGQSDAQNAVNFLAPMAVSENKVISHFACGMFGWLISVFATCIIGGTLGMLISFPLSQIVASGWDLVPVYLVGVAVTVGAVIFALSGKGNVVSRRIAAWFAGFNVFPLITIGIFMFSKIIA